MKKTYASTEAEVMSEIARTGAATISAGVFLQTREGIQKEQSTWDDEEKDKHGFSTSDFWLTTDNGAEPEGYDTIQEAIDAVGR